MAWKEYGYTSRWHRRAKRSVYRPLIDIEVSADGKSETFSALIDSGTEVTIMNEQIAQLLGINSVGKTSAGVYTLDDFPNMQKMGYIAKVNIVVPGFPCEVMTTKVIFADGTGNSPFDILLGQDDFFRRFLIPHTSTLCVGPPVC